METEFTQVRHTRKKTDPQRQSGGTTQRNDGRDMMGKKMKEVRNGGSVEKINVSNRFGSLIGSGELEELRDDVGREGENKENENNVNLKVGGSSRVLEKVMAFAATGVKGNQSKAQPGLKEKKANNLRSLNLQRPKPKPAGPTRGLVYGPARGEMNLSLSGKRLRVEKENIGGRGGVFAGDGGGDGSEKKLEHGSDLVSDLKRKELLDINVGLLQIRQRFLFNPMMGFGSGRSFLGLESPSKVWYSQMDGLENL
ncbi:hypothetical protein IGI04_019140 [Brassica rapa subsp. trilocularis]|uniref:DUF3741 domain-containing protein n=1 Tax=Brassica rapa subsp. trilocularis TaxID=1813537 RepID=A0ABQ7MIF4_BRACM|nr:hypothetical protein IGI04_019140 [Brassica rapa subsp. trilocularis]